MTADPGRAGGGPRPTIRPAGPDELAACASIWRTAINDHVVRLGQD
jgi:hypothetical protein